MDNFEKSLEEKKLAVQLAIEMIKKSNGGRHELFIQMFKDCYQAVKDPDVSSPQG